ncbi:hypothetical protein OPQ81_004846 [Rhizoctonia solani]|nr:hypothetical protein OPQ81_004846 [Rhizoctonia solani]
MDTQLNDAGRAQAKLTGRSLKEVNFVKAYSSDSSRAANTAREIVAYHSTCELVLDRRIRERNMGSLSGTKAPAKRPLPSDIESSRSVEARLLDFWANVIIPLLSPSANTSGNSEPPNAEAGASPLVDSVTHHAGSRESHTPAVLVVSHGATISKLITQVLLRMYGYEAACEMRRGIYNTSISIVRMRATSAIPKSLSRNDSNDAEGNGQPLPLVSGMLISYASIAHLIQKRDIVMENADLLGK